MTHKSKPFDKTVVEKLEFHKIIELAKRYCYGRKAASRLDLAEFYFDKEVLDTLLSEISEYRLMMDQGEAIPIMAYESISEDLYLLAKENYVLDLESILRIRNILEIVQQIQDYFKHKDEEDYPLLRKRFMVPFDKHCLKGVDALCDAQGEIKSDASPQLVKIAKSIQQKEREIEKKFKAFINSYASRNWLSESPESSRNGRRVLSVPAEHKRKIKGIIHDESSTGKTVFIEPDEIVQMNNELFELENEKRREIYRLIEQICVEWRMETQAFQAYEELIADLDIIQAKAKLAGEYNGFMPEIRSHAHYEIWNGRHPLLFLSLHQKKKPTVAFNFTLKPPNKLVIISGPNAGGKTVLMKSIGLIQLMLQAAYLVPCDDHSVIGIVNKIFTDIGDEQSIEDDLSTYSSRLKNMNTILQEADQNSLVLIDEFGSGTDPAVGGAIAEAMLRQLNTSGVWGVITTHYSNLKSFAHRTKGMVNASMLFDKKALRPTYQLKIGSPGSSFAFEIAANSGLSKELIDYAKKRTGKKEYATDKILSDLQDQKRKLDFKLDDLKDKENRLEKLIKNYEQLQQQLDYQRKKHKLLVKERNLQEKSEASKDLQKVIRELREKEKVNDAKELTNQIKNDRKKLQKDIKDLKQDLFYQDKVKLEKLKVGKFAKLRTGSAIGQITRIEKSRAEIMIGAMRMEVDLNELLPAKEPLEINSGKSVQAQLNDHEQMRETEVDIRGYRVEEANLAIEQFIDKAIVANLSTFRIVHGKGNGVLRKIVQKKLRNFPGITEYYHPEREQGGDGVTIVNL